MGEGQRLQPGQPRLTPEQEVAARRSALEQIAAQFSTEPVNEAEAEAWLQAAYQVAGLQPPSTIIWLDNPLQFMALVLLNSHRMVERIWQQVWERVMDCLKEREEAREWERLWTDLWESVLQSVQASVGQDVWNSVGDRVRAGLLAPGMRASVLDQVSSSLESSVVYTLWEIIWESVGEDLLTSVLDRLRGSVGDQVFDSVQSSVGTTLQAQHGLDRVGTSVRESLRPRLEHTAWEQERGSERVGEHIWDQVGTSVLESVSASLWEIEWENVWEHVGEEVGATVWSQVLASMTPMVRGGVMDPVFASVRARVWEAVRARVWERLWERLWAAVQDGVRASLRGGVLESIYASVLAWEWESVGEITRASVEAYEQVPWLACVRFFDEYLAPNDRHALAHFNERVSGYWLGRDRAVLVRRPRVLSQDAAGRWHHERGKCVEYPDGWGFYAWHGVQVPEQIILRPETLTREDFIGAPNVEVRRVIQERMGSRFVAELGGQVMDTGPRGTLYEVRLPEDDPERVARYVQVQDASTPRQYFLRVPPTIQTAAEAVAWSFSQTIEEYRPVQEA